MNKFPLFLSILLYLLIYFLRSQQGGWEPKVDILKNQRAAIDQRITNLLPSPQAELLSGILLGQNKNLPGELKLALRDTATLHIVVASGQNLSMVAGFFLALAGLIKRRSAIALSLIAVSAYILLTGFQVPIVRAAVMFALTALAQLYGRQKEGFRILLITAGLMLLINPVWIGDLSFQLSFLATLGVVMVAPIFLAYLKVLPFIGQDLAVTLGAQLMVMPVIIQNFHQLSLVSVLANLLVGWSVIVIMILGSIMLAFSFIWAELAQILAISTGALLTYFVYVVQFFASLPFAWEYMGEQGWMVWVGYYMVAGGILLAIKKKTDYR